MTPDSPMHMHMFAQDPHTGERFCTSCSPHRPIPVLTAPGEWQDARDLTSEELESSLAFVRHEVDKLIKEIESQRKEIEMNNDNPTTDEPSNQPGEPEPTTPSSSEINASDEREAEVLSDPELMAGINKGIEDAKEGRTTPVDFSEHLEEENAGDGEGALAQEKPTE